MSAYDSERRLLLSEDAGRQVWLDLETGEQVEVPIESVPEGETAAEDESEAPDEAPNEAPGPIMAVVVAMLEEMELRHQFLAANEVSVVVRQYNLTSSTRLVVDEDYLAVRVVSDLPLRVPEHRRAAVCEAAMRFMCARTWASVMINLDVGDVQVAQTLLVGDVLPTPAAIRRCLMNVLWSLDVLHPVLVAVSTGVAEPGETEALSERIAAGLEDR